MSVKSDKGVGVMWHQGAISSKFYMKLLLVQIPKVQKDTDNLTKFLHFWDLRV